MSPTSLGGRQCAASSWWRNLASQAPEETKLASRRWLGELKVCSFERGKQIHAQVNASGKCSFIYLAPALVKMYARCGRMVDARLVFEDARKPNVALWSALISGYAANGEGLTALDMFARMRSEGCAPNCFTFVAALQASTSLVKDQAGDGREESLKRGKEIHSQIGRHSNLYVQNTLIDMYAKSGSMTDARLVFDSIENPDLVSWNAIILGYADNGEGVAALSLFTRMKSQGCKPNSVTYIAALKACISLAEENGSAACLEQGKQLHLEIGCLSHISVLNTLISMYSKCGSMLNAHQVFEDIESPDVVSWNALILGYAENGEGLTALNAFSSLRHHRSGTVPNFLTFVAALKACSSLALGRNRVEKLQCLERGKQIHALVCRQCLNIYLQCTLIDMYAKCGSMADAHRVFNDIRLPNVVAWNALVLGYADNGEGVKALDCFGKIRTQGLAPNSVTFIAALKACSALALDQDGYRHLETGKQIQLQIGCHSTIRVKNTLIDMYCKFGSMVDARQTFDSIENPDVASWTALISGYAENGESLTALELFGTMKAQGCSPNCRTYLAALKASGSLGAFHLGRRIHADIVVETGDECRAILVTSLVDFYANCGNMVEARKLFDANWGARDLTTWNALCAGYARLGDSKSVFQLLKGMQDAGLRPNGVTFLCILTCCNHAGHVEKANEVFETMSANYEINPTLEHYTCMADIFGRSNKLDDAMALVRSMPYSPDAVTWTAVLGACRKWKNVGVARLGFTSWVSLPDAASAAYVLMAHIYGSRGMWQEQQMVLAMRKC